MTKYYCSFVPRITMRALELGLLHESKAPWETGSPIFNAGKKSIAAFKKAININKKASKRSPNNNPPP